MQHQYIHHNDKARFDLFVFTYIVIILCIQQVRSSV